MAKLCMCTLGQSLTGDGCRWCQPQEHIGRLGEWLDEERQEKERLVSALDSAATMLEVAGYVDTAKNHRELLAQLEAGKGGE